MAGEPLSPPEPPLPRKSFRVIKKSGMLNDTIMQRPGVTELLIFENEVYVIN